MLKSQLKKKKSSTTSSEMLPGVNVSKCYPLRITHKTAQVIAERFYYEDKQGWGNEAQ